MIQQIMIVNFWNVHSPISSIQNYSLYLIVTFLEMKYLSLIRQINSLPQSLRQEVYDFVEFLKSKGNKNLKKKKPREFGLLKDKITLSEDFDEPLDDFKGYM